MTKKSKCMLCRPSIFVFALMIISNIAFAQDLNLYKKAIYHDKNTDLSYRILLPENFDSSLNYPLLIFLHGALEKGSDNEAQLDIGGEYFLREHLRDSFPAIVIFPQCPVDDLWAYFETTTDSSGVVTRIIFPSRKQPTTISTALMHLIDSLSRFNYIDKRRVYIAGLSQGAMGVLDLIARYPQTFAAGLSICGAGNVNTAKHFAGRVSLWLFHGNKDDVLPVYFSRDFYRKLTKEGADVKYSEYKNVYHNSWVNAFAEPDLMPWLFSKSKPNL